jgi:hypothetical protein
MAVRSAVVAVIFATCVFTYVQAEQSVADAIVSEMETDVQPLDDEEFVQLEMEADCVDVAPTASCATWDKAGQCKTLPAYMKKNCAKQCGFCGAAAVNTTHVNTTQVTKTAVAKTTVSETKTGCFNTEATYECRGWAATGQCKSNAAYMKKHCAKACGFCGSFKEGDMSKFRAMELRCENVHSDTDCETWSKDGQCTSNEGFMTIMCKKSCGLCGTVKLGKPAVAPVEHYVYGGLVNSTTESAVAPVMRKQTYTKYVPVTRTTVKYHTVAEDHQVPVTRKVVTHTEVPEEETRVVHIPINYTERTVYHTRYTPELHYKDKVTYEPIHYKKVEHIPEPEIKYVTRARNVPTLKYVTKTKSIPVVSVKTVTRNITVMEKVPIITYQMKPVQKTISFKESVVSYVDKNYSVPVLGSKTITRKVPVELNRTLTRVVDKIVKKPVYRAVTQRIPIVTYKNVTTAHVIKTAHATKVEHYTRMVPETQTHDVVRYKRVRTQHTVKQQIPETAQRKEVYTRYVVDEKATAERAVKVAQRQAKQTSQVVSSGMTKWHTAGAGRVVQVGTPRVVSQKWQDDGTDVVDDDGVDDDAGTVVDDTDDDVHVVDTNTTMA